MRTWLKIIVVSLGVFLVLLGLIFLMASFSPFELMFLIEAVVLLVLGGACITGVIAASAREKKAPVINRTTIEINANELVGGDKSVEKLKCSNCGASLSSKDVRFTDIGLIVNCPYCDQVYAMEEKAKW